MPENTTKEDIQFYNECLDMLGSYNQGGTDPELSREQLDRFHKIAGELMNNKIMAFFGR